MATLGETIKRAREAKGISVIEVSRKLNVTRNAVYKWEKDENPPSTHHLVILSRLLGVNLFAHAAGLEGQKSVDAALQVLPPEAAAIMTDSFLSQIEATKKLQKP